MLNILIKILLICCVESKLELIFTEDLSTYVSMSKCVAEVCQRYFTNLAGHNLLIVVEDPTSTSLFRYLLEQEISKRKIIPYYMLCLYRDIVKFKTKRGSFEYVLIEMSSISKFKDIICMIIDLPCWNPLSKFLVVSYETFKNASDLANDLIHFLWEKDITKTAILLPREDDQSSIDAYTTSTFRRDSFFTNSCKNGSFLTQEMLYKKILPRLSSTPIKIKYYPWPPSVITKNNIFDVDRPGIEGKVINTIIRRLKVNVTYTSLSTKYPKGSVYPNRTLVREFIDLFEKRYDVLAGGYVSTLQRIEFFTPSLFIHKEGLLWCVPKHDEKSVSFHMQKEVMLGLILTFFLLLSLIEWINKHQESNKLKTSFWTVVLNGLAICFSVSATNFLKTKKLRCFVGILIIFSYLCSILITGQVTSSFIMVPNQKYDTMKKIYESNLSTYIVTNAERYFSKDIVNDVPRNVIIERMITCQNTSYCLKLVAEGHSALFNTRFNTHYLVSTDNVYRDSIYFFQYPADIYVSLIMRKGFMYIEEFDKNIMLMQSSGLIDKWIKEFLIQDVNTKIKFGFNAMKLVDFLKIAYIPICGYFFSILVFVCEILYKQYLNKYSL
ncbi:Ionotropic receptor 115 [Diabrotica virgifera virgifera]|nr:Ionotropic receptor 115 [Diabrotica virgifera virgifera]